MEKYSKFNLFLENGEDYILFNTLSGEAFLIEEDLYIKMKNNNIKDLPEEYFKEFYDKKIIIDEKLDENKLYDYYRNKVIYQNNHLSYTLLLTWACNLRCVYCYEGAGEVKSHSLKRKTSIALIKYMQNEIEMRGSKSISIILFGGEPLVNFKEGEYILEKMKTYCDENRVTLISSIITNGTLLNEVIIKSLIKYNCQYIQITLDGVRDIHDERRIGKHGEPTFDKIIEKLKLLNKYRDKFHVVIRVNVDKINYPKVPELLEFLKENDLDKFSIDFGIVRSSTDSSDNYEDNCIPDERVGETVSKLWKNDENNFSNMKSYPERKWTYCGLDCDNNYTIDPIGEIYKCWEHVGHEEYRMGKIDKDGSIIDINYNFYDWMTSSPVDREPCKDCIYLPACGGGCRSISFKLQKEFHESQCFKVKGVLEEEIRNWLNDYNQ